MVEDIIADFSDHHTGDHMGGGDHGPGGMPADMMDPELMNEEMLAGIPEFMDMVRQRAMEFVEMMQADGRDIRPDDILQVAYSLEQPLIDFGVS